MRDFIIGRGGGSFGIKSKRRFLRSVLQSVLEREGDGTVTISTLAEPWIARVTREDSGEVTISE